MEISIIIMTLNNRDVLRRAIEMLFAQAFPHDQYEIIVVDAYSTDGTAEMVQAFDGPVPVRLVMQPGRGRAAARNLGARAARGRILLYLDSDIWADPGLLAAHHAHYRPGVRRVAVQGVHPFHPDTLVTPFNRRLELVTNVDCVSQLRGVTCSAPAQRNLSSGGNYKA